MLGNMELVCVCVCLQYKQKGGSHYFSRNTHVAIEFSLCVAVVLVRMHVQYEEDLVQCESPL